MTVKELYELAKSMMFEKKTSRDYDNYYIPWINSLLSENFDLNNKLREKHDKDPYETFPTVSKDTDEIPFEREMCYEVLPYGLAKNFFIDDDTSKFDIFNVMYQNAQQKYMWGTEEDVVDVYSTSDF